MYRTRFMSGCKVVEYWNGKEWKIIETIQTTTAN